jgi:hypothetical protein
MEENLAPDGAGTAPAVQRAARRNDTSVLLQKAWGQLAVRLSAILSLFATAFVVGYFYAIGIYWFSLFSLSEQLVLVLRSLPIAIGATLLLLMIIKLSLDDDGRHNLKPLNMQHSVHANIRILRSNFSKNPLLVTFKVMWLVCVVFAAICMFRTRHIGTCISFIFVIIGTTYFEFLIIFKRTAMHVLYWSIKVAIICLFMGFISGYSILMENLPFMDMPYYNVAIEKKDDATDKNPNTAKWKGDSYLRELAAC